MCSVGILENLKKIRKTNPSVEVIDKSIQVPEEDTESILETEINEFPKAGEFGWEYVPLRPPEELQIVLASLWENTEETYVVDFSQVLFLQRVALKEYVPFIKFVMEQMQVFLNKPTYKQAILREFQMLYNSFDKDIRNDEEFKAEYHYRYVGAENSNSTTYT